MSNDLARTADAKKTCPFALVVKALSKHDAEGSGFVKVIIYNRHNRLRTSILSADAPCFAQMLIR